MLSNWSIKYKLIFLVTLVSIISSGVGFLSINFNQINLLQTELKNEILLHSKLIGEYSVSTLLFQDTEGAENILKKINNIPYLKAAILLDTNRNLFAFYKKEPNIELKKYIDQEETIRQTENLITLKTQVNYQKHNYGYIILIASAEKLEEKKTALLNTIIILLISVLGLSILLATMTQGIISRPIQKLSNLASKVAYEKDYNVRASINGSDEIAELYSSFNSMLDVINQNIAQRDQAAEKIEKINLELENRVIERTSQLEQTLKQLTIENNIRKETERKQIRLKEEAENANKAKSQFLANMSHEIRTPMNAILGFSELLNKRVTDPICKKHIRTIITSGNTLMALINDILDLSKIEAGKLDLHLQNVNIENQLNEIRYIFSPRIEEKKLDFIITFQENLPKNLLLDEIRIRQILFNLVGNAIKFTHSGYVKIEVKYNPLINGKIDLIINVEDTGIGISPEFQTVIFDEFFQQIWHDQKEYGGTGLGLTITKKLVEKMNGKISVKSQLSRGSVFSISFNEIDTLDTAVSNDSNQFIKSEVKFEPSTILVVDDIEFNRELVKEYLIQANVRILEAANANETLKILENNKPDIILMDIRIPIIDGFQLTEMIREKKLSDCPILAFTASAMMTEHQKIEELFDGCISKPIEVNELFNELKRFIPYRIEKKTVKKINVESTEAEILSLPIDLIENLDDFLLYLTEIKEAKIKKFNDGIIINDIEEFIIEMRKIIKGFKFPDIEAFLNNLSDAVSSYDIIGIKRILASFDDIIKKISTIKDQN